MRQLDTTMIACIAGGMTVEKYDETTKALFDNVRKILHNNLERLDKLASLIQGGYADLGNPTVTQDDL